MSWEYWVIAISIGVVALAVVALVVFLIITLLSLRQTVKKMNNDIEAFDPFVRIVHGVGDALEKRSKNVKQLSQEVDETLSCERQQAVENTINTALEVTEWALIGFSLLKKIKGRK